MKSIKATITSTRVFLLAYLLGLQFHARAQTNIYTMPPTDVRGAIGRVFIINGSVSSVHVVDGGKGYTTPPNVAIVLTNGTGSGAVVTATVANGSVNGLILQNPGSYSSPASGILVIDLPPNPLQAVIQSNLYGTIILPAGYFEMTTVVSNNVTIRGQGMGLTTVSGGGRGSVFRVTPGKTVAFENITITRGLATNGAGIYNDAGLVTVQGCRISDNEATGLTGEGGGIYNRGSAVLIVTNSVVSNNTSKRNGGGISNSGLNTAVLPPLAGTLQNLPNTLRGFYSDLQDNVRYGINFTADYFGNLVASPPDFSKIVRNALSSLNSADFSNLGKIDQKLQEYFGKSQDDSTGPMDDSVSNVVQANGPGTITNAMADPYSSGVGGATGWVDMAAPVLFILNSTISDNRVTTPFSGFGGGIHNDLGLVFIDNSTIENNLADSNLGTFGGGINSIFGAIRIQNSRINNNTARSKTIFAAGGAVLSFAGFLDVHDSEFRNNQVEAKFLSSGGAIKHTAGARGTIEDTKIIGNRSGGGGGIANDYLGKLTINRTTIESNSVSGVISANGGGIRNDLGGELEISNSTFSFNVASDRSKGGGLYNHAEEKFEIDGQSLIGESKVSLVNCTFSSNRVDGTYLKIPNPLSLSSCLLAQQYPPYTPCNFNSLPTTDIPLTSRGGAIYNGAEGGGEAELTLSACTVNGNSATGPLYVAGGVYLTGAAGLNPTNIGLAVFKFGNSIVARNTGLDFSKDILPSPASAQSQGGNLDSDGTLYSAVLGSGITTMANPGLGPLRNNGGPTRTHSLLTGSPAINTGSSGNCPATDQRGVSRSLGGACDIGAVEKVNPFGFPDSYVALQEQPLIVNADSGVLSNDFADAATAQLVSGVSNGTLSLSPDGSFTYTGNTNFFGTNTFTYRLVDGAFQSAPILVTITVRPVLKIVSTSPVTNRVDAPLNSDVAMAFNHSLNAGTVPGSVKVRGAQSRVPNSVPVAGGASITVNPPVDFRPGESVSVSVLKSLKAANGAELLKPAQWQFTADALRGDGVFKPGPSFGSYGSGGAAIGDFDGDGDLDIFVARRASGDQVWRNDGNGLFTMAQSFRDNSSGAAVGDLDGDGDLDIVVSKWGGFDDVVPAVLTEYHTVLRNNGVGTFTETGQKIIPDTFRDALSPNTPEPFRYTAMVGATGVKLADLNGDGNLDILFLGGLTEAFYLYRTPGNCVWLNNGSGYFEPVGQFFGDSLTYDAALGDLDGDGDIDVFTANSYYGGTSVPSQVWLNDGSGHFSLGYQTDGFWGRAIALGDLDRDGDLDAVICGAAPDPVLGLANRTRVLANNGLANFTATQFVGDSTTENAAIADINADGHLDLLLSQGFYTYPWTNNGSGSFTWNGTKMPGLKVTELCPGDFDGDGDVDVFVANARQPGDVTPNDGIQNQIWYNNNFPVATNDFYNMSEDGFLSASSVLVNDSDADGDPLVAETTTTIVHRGTLGQLIGLFGPANNYSYEGTYPSGSYVYNQVVPLFSTNGTLNFFSNGTFTYRPNTNFFGTDIFQYVVTDGYLRKTGIVTITVSGVNDPPLARDDYYSISGTNLVVNAAGGVLANDTDVEGTPLTASVVTLPGHGSLTLNTNGSFTYTRNVGWTGTDSFVYRASDGATNATARVKIGNAPPLAANDNYALPGSSLTVNAASGVLVNDTDPDGDTNFTAVLATPPGFGTLQLNANGSFTYNRATNYSGNDSFTYFASDGFELSPPARVKLGNAAPVAVTNSYNAFSGTALNVPVAQGVLANDTDAEGDMLAAVLVTPPTNGVLTLSSNGSFTYTASGNFSGIDSFTYRATDGLLNSSPVVVTFTVNGRLQVVAVSPTINAINVATNSTVEITFNVPPSLPTVTSNRVLIYGSLSGYHSWSPGLSSNKLILSLTTPCRVGESVRVALQPGIRGTGLFELETPYAWNFTIGSPRGGLNFTEITPSPTNHTNIRVALGDVNGDGRLDAMTVGGFDAPGVLYLNNGGGSFTERLVGGEDYRQIALGDLDRDGDIDAFVIGTYRERWLNDGAGNFTISQMPFVSPLITHMTLADLDRDGDLDVFLAAVDYSIPAGQGIVWSLLNDGSGNFTESQQTFIVNSVANAALGDMDSDGDLDAYLVGLNGDVVLFNNGSGVFTAGTQTIDSSFNQDVDLNDLDGDGDVDAFVVTGDGNRAGRIYYNDGSGRFLPSGLSPQPRRLSSSLALGDINGDGLLDGVESVALGFPGPVLGTNSVWLNTGTGQYTNRTFAVTAGDGQHVAMGDLDNDGDLDAFFANGQGTPTVNRIWINQSAPQARDDFYAANGSNPVVVSTPGVLANDGTGDGGSIRAILDTLPTKGSVTLNTNGSFTYTPGGSFTGADVFTYYATDGSQTSRIARVKIGNAVPSATNDGTYLAIAGTPLNVTAAGGVLANDGDPEGDTLTAILNTGPIHGSLQLKQNGSFVYTATNGYVGADSFTYRANDGVSNSGLATVTFDVRSQLVLLERTPAANELRARTDANVVLRFNAALNPASISNNVVISGSASGPMAFSSTLASNLLTLNPVAEFFVGEQITVLLTDDVEGSSSQRLAKPLVWQFNVEAPFGRGNFTDSGVPLVNTNASTARVMFADFNRDGYLDVLCVNNKIGPFTNRVGGSNSVWFGTAQGTLVDSGQRFLGAGIVSSYFSTTMGDIDGDGDIDLVSRLAGRHDFWTNNGAGFFGLSTSISNAVWDGTAELADLDGDKDLDLFILGPSDVSILTNNGTGQFTGTGQVLQPGTSLQALALGDLDGDGDMDAIVQPFFAAARILLNNGVGVFSDTGQALGLGGQRVCLGDFDGDGDLDFIESRSPSLLFINDGHGNFTQSSQVFDSFTTQEIKPADLDGDGDLDLVIQASEFINGTNANRMKIWYNDGAGNFTPTAIAFGTVQMANFGVADVNRDGALDVLINRSTFVDPLPVERWFNSIAMGLIEGGTTLTINDTETTSPFSAIILRSPPSLNVSLLVRLDNIAKGSFTPASLAASGFTGPVGNTYSRTASSAATAQAALRQLVFAPTQNRTPVGQFELTALTIEGTDGTTSRTNSATVVKSISVNTPPVANNDGGAGFGTTESAAFTTANVLTNDLDVDPQDVLSIQSVNTSGLPGTLNNLGNGTFQYIPGSNFVSLPLGATTNKTVQYTISDVSGALASATVTLTITGQNSVPVAANDTIMVGEKAGTVIITSQMLLNDYDVDAGEQQSLIVSAINTNGTSGIVSLLAGDAVSYNRNGAFGNLAPGATANTTFGYTLRDVHNATSSATVTLTIIGTNDVPVAQDDVLTLNEIVAATNVTARLLSNDSDPDPGHTADLVVGGIDTANTIGSVVLTNQSVIYSPNGQFSYLTNGQSATDSFIYFITDTNGATASASLTVTILGTNTPPTAVVDEIALQENVGATNVTALLLANDSDDDTNQTASLVVNGIALTNTTGAVTFSNGVVTYTPSPALNLVAGQVTNDAFLYIVRDQQGLTATNSATVTIIGVNDAPVAAIDAFQISEDGPAMNITGLLLSNDADPNPGDAASLVIDGVFTNGTVGALTLTNGLLYYNPSGRFFLPPGVTNTDSFLYSVRDRFGSNSIAAVSVNVIGVLSRPGIIISSIVVQTNHHVRLRHNGGDEGYTVQFSQNLNNWQVLGPSTLIGPGLFEYVDTTAPPFGRRNYRILVGVPPIVISSITVQTNGQVRLRHNGSTNGYTVQMSTNLVQWQVLGASTLISPGLFEYVDTNPASGRRFYRIRSP